MTIEPVDGYDLAVRFYARQVVGKGWTDADTGFNDLGLAKGRMEGVGGTSSSIIDRAVTGPTDWLSIIVAPIMKRWSVRGTT